MNQLHARGTDSARVIQVIETKALKGNGTEKYPYSIAVQYWDLEGNLLAEKRENDPRLRPSRADEYWPDEY